jgi:hypothetical protein
VKKKTNVSGRGMQTCHLQKDWYIRERERRERREKERKETCGSESMWD